MERKIVDSINNPLLYITQPVYPPAKPKMQQSYVLKPNHKINQPPLESSIEAKQSVKEIEVEKAVETQTPLKKSQFEEKTSSKKVPVEEKIINKTAERELAPLEKIIKEKFASIEGVVEGKPVHIKSTTPRQESTLEKQQVEVEVEEIPENTNIEIHDEKVAEIDLAQEEKKMEKRNEIVKFGIRSSIEKGKRAISSPKKKKPVIKKEQKQVKELVQVESNSQLERTDEKVISMNQQQNGASNQQQNAELIEESAPQRPRKFKEMSIEEKVEYLVNLPIAVPKIKCEIKTNEESILGIITGYEKGLVQIVQRKKPYRIDIKIEDIVAINRKSF